MSRVNAFSLRPVLVRVSVPFLAMGLTICACGGSEAPAPAQSAKPAPEAAQDKATAPAPVEDAEAPPLAIAANEVVVRVSRLNGGRRVPQPGTTKPRRFSEPILVLGNDRIALWSKDSRGGGPMFTGKVDQAAVEAWATKVYGSGVLTDAAMRSHVGPDASSIELDIKIADQHLKVRSWHEMVDPSLSVALESGIVALDGRDPVKLVAAESAEYQRFLRNWQSLRVGLGSLMPKDATPLLESADLSAFD